MKTEKRYWAPIKSDFGDFAAWVDGEGRLLRFNLRAKGAAHVDPRCGEEREGACAMCRSRSREYDAGKRQDFDVRAAHGEGPHSSRRSGMRCVEIPLARRRAMARSPRSSAIPMARAPSALANGANPIALDRAVPSRDRQRRQLTGYGGGLPLKRALAGARSARRPGTRVRICSARCRPCGRRSVSVVHAACGNSARNRACGLLSRASTMFVARRFRRASQALSRTSAPHPRCSLRPPALSRNCRRRGNSRLRPICDTSARASAASRATPQPSS